MRLMGLDHDTSKTWTDYDYMRLIETICINFIDLVFNSLGPFDSNLRRRFDANTKDIYGTHRLAIPDPASLNIAV